MTQFDQISNTWFEEKRQVTAGFDSLSLTLASDECMHTMCFLCFKNTYFFMLYAYINNNLKLNKLFISNYSAVSCEYAGNGYT